MKTLELSNLNLHELSYSEQMSIQGGGETVFFKDEEGFDWSYFYDDEGNLTGWCVMQSMSVR
jgi:YD repeat-containing protein